MNASSIGALAMTGPVDPSSHAIALIGGVATLLCIASLVGYALQRNHPRAASNLVIDNLITRIKAWWVVASIFGFAVLAGSIGIISLFAFASLVALREFVPNPAFYPDRSRGRALGVLSLLAAQYVFIWMQWTITFIVFLPACLMLLSVSRVLQSRYCEGSHQLLWGATLCVYFIGYAPALLMPEIPGYEDRNRYLVVFLVLITQLGDVLQYLWGKLFGRLKVAPIISPEKTVEGTLGGIVSATLLGAGLAAITPFSAAQAAAIAFAIAILGFLGGLALSANKRRRGIKDWGRLIPGHGGMLDRLDSLVLSAPCFFYIVWFGWSA